MSEPVAGNHNDLYDIEVQFEVVTATLEKADIPVDGLFINADAGFDSENFRRSCGERGINANVCFNKRNGAGERDEELRPLVLEAVAGVRRAYAPTVVCAEFPSPALAGSNVLPFQVWAWGMLTRALRSRYGPQVPPVIVSGSRAKLPASPTVMSRRRARSTV